MILSTENKSFRFSYEHYELLFMVCPLMAYVSEQFITNTFCSVIYICRSLEPISQNEVIFWGLSFIPKLFEIYAYPSELITDHEK